MARQHEESTIRWEEQMARVLRWQQRYREISRSNARLLERQPGQMDSGAAVAFLDQGEAARDVAYALMQNIHHLRDWIINDPKSGLAGGEVDDFIKSSKTLRMVGDLCNGSKHAVLKRRRWYEHQVEILPLSVSSEPGAITRLVSSPDGHVDVNDFADAAIKEWDEFLSRRGL